jgi:hypothetical protein
MTDATMTDNNPPELKVPVLVFETELLGSLQVYGFHTVAEALANTPLKEYYWRDAGSPQGFGPFKTISAAMHHYTSIIKAARGGLKLVRSAALIRVDFTNKKRVD